MAKESTQIVWWMCVCELVCFVSSYLLIVYEETEEVLPFGDHRVSTLINYLWLRNANFRTGINCGNFVLILKSIGHFSVAVLSAPYAIIEYHPCGPMCVMCQTLKVRERLCVCACLLPFFFTWIRSFEISVFKNIYQLLSFDLMKSHVYMWSFIRTNHRHRHSHAAMSKAKERDRRTEQSDTQKRQKRWNWNSNSNDHECAVLLLRWFSFLYICTSYSSIYVYFFFCVQWENIFQFNLSCVSKWFYQVFRFLSFRSINDCTVRPIFFFIYFRLLHKLYIYLFISLVVCLSIFHKLSLSLVHTHHTRTQKHTRIRIVAVLFALSFANWSVCACARRQTNKCDRNWYSFFFSFFLLISIGSLAIDRPTQGSHDIFRSVSTEIHISKLVARSLWIDLRAPPTICATNIFQFNVRFLSLSLSSHFFSCAFSWTIWINEGTAVTKI